MDCRYDTSLGNAVTALNLSLLGRYHAKLSNTTQDPAITLLDLALPYTALHRRYLTPPSRAAPIPHNAELCAALPLRNTA